MAVGMSPGEHLVMPEFFVYAHYRARLVAIFFADAIPPAVVDASPAATPAASRARKGHTLRPAWAWCNAGALRQR